MSVQMIGLGKCTFWYKVYVHIFYTIRILKSCPKANTSERGKIYTNWHESKWQTCTGWVWKMKIFIVVDSMRVWFGFNHHNGDNKTKELKKWYKKEEKNQFCEQSQIFFSFLSSLESIYKLCIVEFSNCYNC